MSDQAILRELLLHTMDRACELHDVPLYSAILADRDALAKALRELAVAATNYDDAIHSCANDPDTMASYCTAEGDDLDRLYADWMLKARAALAAVSPQAEG